MTTREVKVEETDEEQACSSSTSFALENDCLEQKQEYVIDDNPFFDQLAAEFGIEQKPPKNTLVFERNPQFALDMNENAPISDQTGAKRKQKEIIAERPKSVRLSEKEREMKQGRVRELMRELFVGGFTVLMFAEEFGDLVASKRCDRARLEEIRKLIIRKGISEVVVATGSLTPRPHIRYWITGAMELSDEDGSKVVRWYEKCEADWARFRKMYPVASEHLEKKYRSTWGRLNGKAKEIVRDAIDDFLTKPRTGLTTELCLGVLNQRGAFARNQSIRGILQDRRAATRREKEIVKELFDAGFSTFMFAEQFGELSKSMRIERQKQREANHEEKMRHPETQECTSSLPSFALFSSTDVFCDPEKLENVRQEIVSRFIRRDFIWKCTGIADRKLQHWMNGGSSLNATDGAKIIGWYEANKSKAFRFKVMHPVARHYLDKEHPHTRRSLMNLTVLAELVEAHARAEAELLCAHYETYTPVRFVLIAVATVIASLGTIGNILLLIVFSAKQSQNSNTPATLYPSVLACLDFAICFEYILLFGVDAFVSYLKIESLFSLYYLYIVPAYVMARITQLAIPYMLIFATLERLFWTSKKKSKLLKAFHSTTGRHVTVAVSLGMCILLRSPSAFAIMVDPYPNCPDFFRTKTTNQRKWAQQSELYHFFDFQVMTIAQTLVPFVLLVGLNLIIVRRMCSDSVQKEKDPEPTEVCFQEDRLLTQITPVHKSSTTIGLSFPPLKSMSPAVRSAVFTMAAIVTSYLISNVLHLILTVLERSGHEILQSEEDPLLSSTFHTFFSDLVSFVYMFTSAIRIVIYYLCNPKIRGDLIDFFANRKNAVYL